MFPRWGLLQWIRTKSKEKNHPFLLRDNFVIVYKFMQIWIHKICMVIAQDCCNCDTTKKMLYTHLLDFPLSCSDLSSRIHGILEVVTEYLFSEDLSSWKSVNSWSLISHSIFIQSGKKQYCPLWTQGNERHVCILCFCSFSKFDSIPLKKN